jgi:transposase
LASSSNKRQWLEFLKQIDREIPLSQHIHIILDNYSTHKHPVIKRWLARHPRFELHFTPTGSSWMNLVERFFRDLSQQAIRQLRQRPPTGGHDYAIPRGA